MTTERSAVRDRLALLCEHTGGDLGPLEQLAADLTPSAATATLVLEIAGLDHGPCARNASWMLKRLIASGLRPEPEHRDLLLSLLHDTDDAMAQLHLLQVLPHLEIEASRADRLYRRLVVLIESKNTFVRAWAYNGLAYLASRHERYHGDVEQRLGEAMASDKPSVRARIRHAADGRFLS